MTATRLAASVFSAAILAAPALADTAQPATPFGDPMFPQQTGEAIYTGVCQGCHMPGAVGASGAGAYPALANDAHLRSGAYPVIVILKGSKAMPGFAAYFTDEQIANVVNYLRSHFGNHYGDTVTAADVRAMR